MATRQGRAFTPRIIEEILFQGTWGSWYGIADVARKTIPLLLLGVGLVVAFRAQFWNIGAEGQMLMGATAAAGLALFVDMPGPVYIPAMFLVGALGGTLWGLLPAFLKIQWGVNEVIATLMMNYVAQYLVQWFIHGPWKGQSGRGFAYTDMLPEAAWLAVLPGTRVLFAAWDPLKAIGGACCFGALYHLAFRWQSSAPPELLKMLPYVCTLVILTLTALSHKQHGAPEALGQLVQTRRTVREERNHAGMEKCFLGRHCPPGHAAHTSTQPAETESGLSLHWPYWRLWLDTRP